MATQPLPAGSLVSSERAPHYIDWGAIVGGVFVAAGISEVLFAFGTAIGFSMMSPYEGEGASRSAYFIALGLWTLWVVVSSFMAGGYIAGRLRRRTGEGTAHESDVRDGAHGLIVWGLGIVLASILMMVGVAGVAGGSAKAMSAIAQSDAGRRDPLAYGVDLLLRAPDRPTPAGEAERQEVARVLTLGTLRGEVTTDNKIYLARLVSARTGLSTTDAERRVNDVLADIKRKADAARKTGIALGFFTAAALFVAGASAAWAATLGGRHRDQGTDAGAFWRW